MSIRPCREDERGAILEIVNAAAEAYRGVIPDDCWHEPYMSARELDAEIAAGVRFWAYELDAAALGVMGVQPKADVDLIRHAYVRPGSQRSGIGGALLRHLRGMTGRRVLVGTWAAADWAIDFYCRHGFELVTPQRKDELLRTYWDIPDRQIETSVVLASPPFGRAPGG
jgi:GNAT superfamily N-acetyltransferase